MSKKKKNQNLYSSLPCSQLYFQGNRDSREVISYYECRLVPGPATYFLELQANETMGLLLKTQECKDGESRALGEVGPSEHYILCNSTQVTCPGSQPCQRGRLFFFICQRSHSGAWQKILISQFTAANKRYGLDFRRMSVKENQRKSLHVRINEVNFHELRSS